jgi:hypothetical protein
VRYNIHIIIRLEVIVTICCLIKNILPSFAVVSGTELFKEPPLIIKNGEINCLLQYIIERMSIVYVALIKQRFVIYLKTSIIRTIIM